MTMPGLIKYKRSREAESWLKKEIAEQRKRYRAIEHEMNVVIAPKRDKWFAEFLENIQTRGYHAHFNMMRKIKPEEIPKKPKRKTRVVF
jgi:hypothetical protein